MADRRPVVVGIGLSDYPIARHLDEDVLASRLVADRQLHDHRRVGWDAVVHGHRRAGLGCAVRVVDLDEADAPLRDRPLPQPDDVSAEFWATVRAYALRVRDDLGIPFWRPAP